MIYIVSIDDSNNKLENLFPNDDELLVIYANEILM